MVACTDTDIYRYTDTDTDADADADADTQIGSRLSVPKLVRGSRWLRNAMGTQAERALLAAVRHVAEPGAQWPGAELRLAWFRMTMTNSRLACRISSDRIKKWYVRFVYYGREPRWESLVDDSAGDSDEPWYDSEDNWHESSSDSSSPTWYDGETVLVAKW